MYVTANGDRAFLQQNISTAVHKRILLALYRVRTTGCTFDSSCSTSRAYPSPRSALSPIMHSKLYSSRLPYIPYRTVFVHRSPPAACNSSSFLSIHQVLVSTQALLLARVGEALAICLCPHPSSNPYSFQIEDVDDKVSARSKMWKMEVVD